MSGKMGRWKDGKISKETFTIFFTCSTAIDKLKQERPKSHVVAKRFTTRSSQSRGTEMKNTG